MHFTGRGGKKATELKFRKMEDEADAKLRHEIDGWNIPPEATVVEDGGTKMFVLPGHEKHPETKVEEEEKVEVEA
jgi:hypothetical protein